MTNNPTIQMLKEGITKAKEAYYALGVPEDALPYLSSDDKEVARRGILAREIEDTLKTLAMGERTKILDEACPWIGAFERFRANTQKELKSICAYCRWRSTYAETGTLPCMVSCPFAFNGIELAPWILRELVNDKSPDPSYMLFYLERIFRPDVLLAQNNDLSEQEEEDCLFTG